VLRDALELYEERDWDWIQAQRKSLREHFKDDPLVRSLAQTTYDRVRVSPEGIVVIPRSFTTYGQLALQSDVIVVGAGRRLELWSPLVHKEFRELNSVAEGLIPRAIGGSGDMIFTLPQTVHEVAVITNASIARNPQLIHRLSPREFEEWTADTLTKLGYQVQLTKATVDGGVDIYAATSNDMGDFLYLVECKKYQDRKVGVEVLRALNGVVEQQRATSGLLVTTSYFSQPAVEFQRTIQHRMALADYDTLRAWMEKLRYKY
jgi:DNA-binding transcriptional regulator/RsmH inhibitor MraZ